MFFVEKVNAVYDNSMFIEEHITNSYSEEHDGFKIISNCYYNPNMFVKAFRKFFIVKDNEIIYSDDISGYCVFVNNNSVIYVKHGSTYVYEFETRRLFSISYQTLYKLLAESVYSMFRAI